MEPFEPMALAGPVPTMAALPSPEAPARASADHDPETSQPRRGRIGLSGPALLQKILAISLVPAEDWNDLAAPRRAALERCADPLPLLELLATEGLLTRYQASRVSSGKTFGLVLGNYRVLDRIGAGAMGVVYKAEHLRMRQSVAIKVLSLGMDHDPQLLARFYAEMRAVARLRHPNIVAALDAGETYGKANEPTLHYFVMEYVQGQDLEAYVKANGPLAAARACQIIYQVASALEEAHRHHLVHRDIKPSNILLTDDDQAKLLDFGLAMHVRSRMTVPGVILGTIDFMAPEQARDASSVDVRADIYSLGATFYWCLTGQTPFPAQESLMQDLVTRLTQPAPSVLTLQPHLALGLDAVLTRMMALEPDNRYQTPQAVARALLHFTERASLHHAAAVRPEVVAGRPGSAAGRGRGPSPRPRVLIVDDEEQIRTICQCFLQGDFMDCAVAASGALALEMLAREPYDLVLLDVNMPGMSGLELVRQLRENAPVANLKIVMFSGHMDGDDLALLLQTGVDDYLTKPFSGAQLAARIKACLGHKQAEDRSERLNTLLLSANAELEKNLNARDSDLVHTRNGLVLGMAQLAAQRHRASGAHLLRMQRFCQCLAAEAAVVPAFAAAISPDFIQMLECCVPLHDIGMVALPDDILLKPGALSPEERILMQQHTILGAGTLADVAQQHGALTAFMQMAGDIARHHHERFDGSGYPDRLQGQAIPLSARLTSLADVYDALRCRRGHRPAMTHKAAVQIMTTISDGQFDPALLAVFERCGPRLEAIFRECGD